MTIGSIYEQAAGRIFRGPRPGLPHRSASPLRHGVFAQPALSVMVALAPLSWGCSASNDLAAKADSGTSGDEEVGTDGQDSGAVRQPAWWLVNATLRVAAGQLSASGSELGIAILDSEGEPICEELFRVTSTSTEATQPEPTILTWWSIERGEGTGECGALLDLEALPLVIQLGVGEMHPEMTAVAGQVSTLPETGTATLNAAYAKTDNSVEDTWVFGFAGDAEAWNGTSGPATIAPLTDGIWTIQGVYGFPLP